MGSINKVFLIGNLGGDAELHRTPAGTAVCNLSLATSEHWTNKAKQRQERTDWHRIVVWDRLAESLEQYLTKGKQICVEGRLQTRNWTDRNGKKRYTTEICADRVTLLGGRSTEPSGLSRAGRGVSPAPCVTGRTRHIGLESLTDGLTVRDTITWLWPVARSSPAVRSRSAASTLNILGSESPSWVSTSC